MTDSQICFLALRNFYNVSFRCTELSVIRIIYSKKPMNSIPSVTYNCIVYKQDYIYNQIKYTSTRYFF